eukprot:107658-Chlamydomonas_euryale.AAC.17
MRPKSQCTSNSNSEARSAQGVCKTPACYHACSRRQRLVSRARDLPCMHTPQLQRRSTVHARAAAATSL